jgi:hypothetical protein
LEPVYSQGSPDFQGGVLLPMTFLALIIIAIVIYAIWRTPKKDIPPYTRPTPRTPYIPPPPPPLPYRTQRTILNPSEAAFFLEMQKQLPQGFYVFPKIRIIDFIAPTDNNYAWRNKIWAKHVDFLICNQYFTPVMAIEVNGGSHQRWDRKERDYFVNEVFRGAKLPLKTVNLGASFAEEAALIAKGL